MASYFGPGHHVSAGKPGFRSMSEAKGIARNFLDQATTARAAVGLGLVDTPGHQNASCGGWPQCANISYPKCGCFDYSWNQTSLHEFLVFVDSLGVRELDIWRGDITPPPGTTAEVPQWWFDELALFLNGTLSAEAIAQVPESKHDSGPEALQPVNITGTTWRLFPRVGP